jgi:hypothetical protein
MGQDKKYCDEVLKRLDVKNPSMLSDLLLPGIRGAKGSVDDTVKFFEPHVAKRRGPEWEPNG